MGIHLWRFDHRYSNGLELILLFLRDRDIGLVYCGLGKRNLDRRRCGKGLVFVREFDRNRGVRCEEFELLCIRRQEVNHHLFLTVLDSAKVRQRKYPGVRRVVSLHFVRNKLCRCVPGGAEGYKPCRSV